MAPTLRKPLALILLLLLGLLGMLLVTRGAGYLSTADRHSHDAVLIFDPQDGRLIECNPRTAEFLGMAPSQLEDIHLTDLHHEDEAFLRSLVDDVMDGAQGRYFRIHYHAGS